MDVLESVLRISKAEEFIEEFRKQGIDASILPILKDEDLKILGVNDSATREKILRQSANLQIPAEKNIDRTVNKEYVHTVLNQIASELSLHHANLACALREDVIVCDIKLSKATECLLTCIDSFNLQLQKLQQKVCPKRSKPKNKWKKAVILMSAASAIFLIGLKFFK